MRQLIAGSDEPKIQGKTAQSIPLFQFVTPGEPGAVALDKSLEVSNSDQRNLANFDHVDFARRNQFVGSCQTCVAWGAGCRYRN